MKATIDQNGLLIIESQTPLESYALNQWVGSNFNNTNSTQNILIKSAISN